MDQNQLRVKGHSDILPLEVYDERKADNLMKKVENINAPQFVSEELLGVACTLSEVQDFERNGKATPQLMTLLLNYVYNHDLLSESCSLPYFMIAQVKDKSGSFEFNEQCNELLKSRRRKVDHTLIIIVALVLGRWITSFYSLVSKSMVLVDLQTSKDLPESLLKTTFINIGTSRLKHKYDVQEYLFIKQSNNDKADGTEWVVNYIYEFVILHKAHQLIKFPSQKLLLRKKLVWVIYLIKYLQQIEDFQKENRKLGVAGNPNLPHLEEYDEGQLKQYNSAFPSVKDDPYIEKKLLSQAISKADIQTFNTSGKCSFSLMVVLLNYIYNQELFTSKPKYPYFILMQQGQSDEQYEGHQDMNLALKERRRKMNHDLIFFLLVINNKWVSSIFSLQQKKLYVVDSIPKKQTPESKLKKILMDLGTEKFKYKYDIQSYQYISLGGDEKSDGSETLINFLYQFLISGMEPDKIKFTSKERNIHRQRLLWLLHYCWELDHGRYKGSKQLITVIEPTEEDILEQNEPIDDDEFSPVKQKAPNKSQERLKDRTRTNLIDAKQQDKQPNYQESSRPQKQNQLQVQGQSQERLKDRTRTNVAPQKYKPPQDLQVSHRTETLISQQSQDQAEPQRFSRNARNQAPKHNEEILDESDDDRRPSKTSKNRSGQRSKQSTKVVDQYKRNQSVQESVDLDDNLDYQDEDSRQLYQAVKPSARNTLVTKKPGYQPPIPVYNPNQFAQRETQDHDEFFNAFHQKTIKPQQPIALLMTKNPNETVGLVSSNQKLMERLGGQKQPRDIDALNRILENLNDYLDDLQSKRNDSIYDAIQLQEIDQINNQIQKVLKQKQLLTMDHFLEELNLKHPMNRFQEPQNYDRKTIDKTISQLLDLENYNDPDVSRRLRKDLVLTNFSKIAANDILGNSSMMPLDSQPRQGSTPLPSRSLAKGLKDAQMELLVADRYGVQVRTPEIQKLLSKSTVSPNILDLLLQFLDEKLKFYQKVDHQGFLYGTSVKIFPLGFYQTLTQNLISNTTTIQYVDASKYTRDYIGQGQTMFDIFDWIIVPIMELPSEYSLIVGNLRSRQLHLFQLSSVAIRITDPFYLDPKKNPFLKNLQNFLHREERVKLNLQRQMEEPYQMFMGTINRDPQYLYKIAYEHSGLYAMYIATHVVKYGNINEIIVQEYQMKTLAKSFHDLIVRIGFKLNQEQFQINSLLSEKKWPF